ncbi:hypothetical protein ACLOJK_008761 [Asimina triloba]
MSTGGPRVLKRQTSFGTLITGKARSVVAPRVDEAFVQKLKGELAEVMATIATTAKGRDNALTKAKWTLEEARSMKEAKERLKGQLCTLREGNAEP